MKIVQEPLNKIPYFLNFLKNLVSTISSLFLYVEAEYFLEILENEVTVESTKSNLFLYVEADLICSANLYHKIMYKYPKPINYKKYKKLSSNRIFWL